MTAPTLIAAVVRSVQGYVASSCHKSQQRVVKKTKMNKKRTSLPSKLNSSYPQAMATHGASQLTTAGSSSASSFPNKQAVLADDGSDGSLETMDMNAP